jgi:hypothetical protein
MGRSAALVWRRMRIGGVLGGGTGGIVPAPSRPLQLDRGMQLPIAAVALPLGCLGFGAAPAIGGQGAPTSSLSLMVPSARRRIKRLSPFGAISSRFAAFLANGALRSRFNAPVMPPRSGRSAALETKIWRSC